MRASGERCCLRRRTGSSAMTTRFFADDITPTPGSLTAPQPDSAPKALAGAQPPGPRRFKALLIEEGEDDAALVELLLRDVADNPFIFLWTRQLAAGLECLARGDIDVVLLDLSLPDSQGLKTLVQ